MADKSASNAAEYSVSDISFAVKRTVEDAYGYVRVRGEISGFRGQHGSGHAYFAMKDEKARLEAVIWKGVYNRLKVKPEEGLEVIATGKITTYPGSSKYQIVIEALEPAGIGALMALLEERKKKLAAEGLFDPARKQLLPSLPKVIGVITSPTGAVIRDIMHRLNDRFPTHVLLWPVRVQGETCGDEVARAIHGFNGFTDNGSLPRPDLLIVARGGGSLEDLWGFNDEVVVRAAATSDIPLISAVGHETDWTLIDHAADLRAPTPTGAAEMAVPVRADLLATLDDLDARQKGAIVRLVQSFKTHIATLSRGLLRAETLLTLPQQRLDNVNHRLPQALTNHLMNKRAHYDRQASLLSLDNLKNVVMNHRQHLANQSLQLGHQLSRCAHQDRAIFSGVAARLSFKPLENQLRQNKEKVSLAFNRGDQATKLMLERQANALSQAASTLSLVSYQSVLKRGFALLRDGAGNPIHSATAIKPGGAYRAQMFDGEADLIGAGGKATKNTAKKAPKQTEQGDLF